MANRKKNVRKNKKLLSAVVSALLVALALVIYYGPELETMLSDSPAAPAPAETVGQEAAVYFLDVGQGDSALIRIGEDFDMLIDAGIRESGDAIEADLDALGVTELDVVVATHPHADHIGAMTQIIETYPIGTFYMPVLPDDQTPTTATYENMLDALDARQVRVEQITDETVIEAPENADFDVLSPRAGDVFDEINDYSAVIRFTYGGVSFMLTGDAEAPVEQNLLDSGAELSAQVLKCGHHGSSSSSTTAFLRAVNPGAAVISCGADNKYGHPHRETLESLETLGCAVLRTDELGTVAVTTDGEAYAVYMWSPEKGLQPVA
ncbi:MAG: ComEC/Rec2 family competence protein [Hominenteromicrobium sp.]